MNKLTLTIGWLYPDLMSTYGDRGNVICLKRRCEERDIAVNILPIEIETSLSQVEKMDLIIGGGAQDRQQEIVMRDLKKEKKKIIKDLIQKGIPGIFTCGAPQLLGHYYEPAYGKRITGLGIFDMVSIHPGFNKPRCIGNIVVEVKNLDLLYRHSGETRSAGRLQNRFWTSQNDDNNYLVGFENHGGRTFLGKGVKPLATVVKGFGNNGDLPASLDGRQVQAGDKTEGAVYKNAIATYLHGPVLPKNPHLADWLIQKALEVKYGKKIKLESLNDDWEWQAHSVMIKRILG